VMQWVLPRLSRPIAQRGQGFHRSRNLAGFEGLKQSESV
jgi:hypothetical protein